ncbi:MAG: zinc ribbon domain-containing protein [Lachnospiraceae bacterium]|nr:zinc ribbon domain-containing protein [Lachnospiraceae bacterium]
MALIKCVECGKMISDRAVVCPVCGCPVTESSTEITVAENEIYQECQALFKSSKPTVFQFGGFRFEYPAGTEVYAALIGLFSILAETISQFTKVSYDDSGEIRKVLEDIPEFCSDILEYLMETINSYLYIFKVDLSLEEFLVKYSDKYELSYEKYYSQVVQAYAEICEEEEGLRQYREAVKASRSRWTGGGFGIKGAVKGAVKAGMLNCVSDFMYSFAISRRAQKDTEIIRKKLRALYKSDKTKKLLCESFHKIVLNLYRALIDEIRPILGDCYSYDINYEKAETLYENTIKYEKNPDIFKKNIAKCIYMYPAEIKYIEIYMDDIRKEEKNDLSAFIRFWKFDDWRNDSWPEKARAVMPCLNFIKCCDEFSNLAGSDEMSTRKAAAQNYKVKRTKEQLEFSANIKRRLGILCQGVTNHKYVVDMPLYRFSNAFVQPIICEEEEFDQHLFWINEEVAVTDYYIYCENKRMELSQVNEITISVTPGKISLFAEKKGGASVPIFCTENREIVEIIILLDVALEPYRELGYESKLDKDIRPLYLKISNTNEDLGLDSDSDKEKKKRIADSIIKKKKSAIDKFTKEKRSKGQIELAKNLRRRFGKMLENDVLKQVSIIPKGVLEGIMNRKIFELEAEGKIIPDILSEFDDNSGEHVFYAEDNLAITDYHIYAMIYDKNGAQHIRCRFSLYEINEIIYSRLPKKLYIYWKKEGSFINEHRDFTSYEVKYSFEPLGTCVVLLLNIVLEPYSDTDYYTHVLHSDDRINFLAAICNYEKEYGNFENALKLNQKDKELLQEKKDIHRKWVNEELKKMGGSDTSGRDTAELLFQEKFEELFSEFYKIDGSLPKYYGFMKNVYDFDIINYLPEKEKKQILELRERGQKVLYVSEDVSFVITNKCVSINHKEFVLSDLCEILICKPLPVYNEDLICLDQRIRIFARVKEGEKYLITCMYYEDKEAHIRDFSDMVYSLNYTLSTIKGLRGSLFKNDMLFLCERCGSTDFETTLGIRGQNKGYCRNCYNRNKNKISVYRQYYILKKEKYREVENNFLEKNKDLQLKLLTLWKEQKEETKKREKEGKFICKTCGKEIKKDSKFCNFCGQPVNSGLVKQEKKFCVHCGKEILREAKFCNFCGKANK